MITEQEFKKRADENEAEYNKQLLSNSFDLKKFHGFDCEAGKASRSILSRKGNDILDAVIHRMLPVLTKASGVDAYKCVNGVFIPVELKSSYTDESKFFRTKQNAIYSVTLDKIVDGCVSRNNTTSFKSNFNATFEIRENLDVKNLEMYFTVRDSRDDRIIEVIKVSGKDIHSYLSSRQIPSSGHVPIKLTTCEQLGERVTTAIVDIVGLDVWKNELLKTLPLIKVISPKKSTRKNISLLKTNSQETRTDPSEQISTPYTKDADLSETEDQQETQPIFPFG